MKCTHIFLSLFLFVMCANGLAMEHTANPKGVIVIDPNLLKQEKSGGTRAILNKVIPAASTGRQLLSGRMNLLKPSNIQQLIQTGKEAGKTTKGMFNIVQKVNPKIEEITRKRLAFDEVMQAAAFVSKFMPHINQETKDVLSKMHKEGFILIFASNRDLVEHVARMKKEQKTQVAFDIEEMFDHIIVVPIITDNLTDHDKQELDILRNNINKDKTHEATGYHPSAEYFELVLNLAKDAKNIHWLMGQREYTELEKIKEYPKNITYILCENNKNFLETLSQLSQPMQTKSIEDLD